MEATIRRLKFLEEQSLVWRKKYEDEERRIEEEYQRNLAEINAAFREAAQQIKLEYAAKRAEVIKQHTDEQAGKGTIIDPNLVITPCKSVSVCTTSPSMEVNVHQSTARTSRTIRKPLLAHTPKAGRDRNNSSDDRVDDYNQNDRIEVWQYDVCRIQCSVCGNKLNKNYKSDNCGFCCVATAMTTIGEIFVVFDPGGDEQSSADTIATMRQNGDCRQ